MGLFVKNTLEINFERKEIIMLFISIIFLTSGVTMIIGMFCIAYTFYHIVNRITINQEYSEFTNMNFVN